MGVTTVEAAADGVETLDFRREVIRSFTEGGASFSADETLLGLQIGE